MLRYTVRRLLQLVLVLFVLSLLLFIWLRSLPGGPVTALLGERATPEKREELTALLGLDQPIFVQYFKFLGRVLQGNFGQSTGVSPGTSAIDVFFTRFGATIELTIGAMIFGLVARHPARATWRPSAAAASLDNSAIVISLIGIAVPVFFLAFLLKYVFAVKWGLLPPSGRQTPGIDATRVTGLFIVDGLITREWDASWDSVRHLILPWIALGTIPFAVIFRITRASVLEVQGEDFVRTAEAKGLTNDDDPEPARPAQRHAAGDHGDRAADRAAADRRRAHRDGLRATRASVRRSTSASPRRTIPVVQVVILAAAAAFVIINTLVDLAYALVDPRIRTR